MWRFLLMRLFCMLMSNSLSIAGDHLKFGLPMAYSTTVLAWGLLEYWDAYEKSAQLEYMLDSIKWPLDFFIKAHPKPDEFYAQVGDPVADHAYWGPPELMKLLRPAYLLDCDHPGTEVAGETASAMAAGYLAFKDVDSAYADELLLHAKQLYDFGKRCPGSYIKDGKVNAATFYDSFSGYKDELGWSAAWLYHATGDAQYLEDAETIYEECCSVEKGGFGPGEGFSWDNKKAGVNLLLLKLTNKPVYQKAVTAFLDGWVSGTAIKQTPKGLSYFQKWGPLRYAATHSFLALLAADLIPENAAAYRTFAKSQIHYILGDCCLDPMSNTPTFSYLIGFSGAKNFPRAPHHRGASCDIQGKCSCTKDPEYHTLFGALVGGPSEDDEYIDDCSSYEKSEVATDYNAGFQSALAGETLHYASLPIIQVWFTKAAYCLIFIASRIETFVSPGRAALE